MTLADPLTPVEAATSLAVPSPIGPLVLSGDDDALCGLALPGAARARRASTDPASCGRSVHEAARQLEEYFAGRRRTFDVALALHGTAFQQQVWRALGEIGFGETISYAELARRVGRPRACRAVGQANGANPIPIILPCHRVIAADGTIGGYGGGLAAKRTLLALETER